MIFGLEEYEYLSDIVVFAVCLSYGVETGMLIALCKIEA